MSLDFDQLVFLLRYLNLDRQPFFYQIKKAALAAFFIEHFFLTLMTQTLNRGQLCECNR